jgi:phosphatidylglycerophosphatase GEP4
MRPSFLGKLGQSMNVAGISLFLKLAVSDASLAVPHIDCESIQDIDWFKLKKAGFTAVIFDKDNTLTIPYATEVHPPLRESMKECKQAFGNERVCVYSNSAGLEQYDPDGIEAKHLEGELGIRVARHKEKKPSGSGAELAKFLNSNSSNSSNEKEKSKSKSSESAGEAKKENSPCEKFVFVGDRYLTDVVFGNKSGMFTIRVAPFDVSNESKAIAAARSIESYFLHRWRTKNKTKPTPHALDERNEEEESVYLKTNAARSWREER